MARYNPSVLKGYADNLYMEAYLEIIILTLLGLGIGYLASMGLETAKGSSARQIFLIGFCGFIGLLIGLARSQQLRIKAQTILCQVAIEENTRIKAHASFR